MPGKEEGERRRPEAGLYKPKRSHSWDISLELHLEGGKKVEGKKPKTHHPSPGCCTVIYKLNSEKRGQNSLFLSPQISVLAQQRIAFGLQEHSSQQQEDKRLPSPPDSLAERRHMGFNCIQRCHSRDTRMIRAHVTDKDLSQLGGHHGQAQLERLVGDLQRCDARAWWGLCATRQRPIQHSNVPHNTALAAPLHVMLATRVPPSWAGEHHCVLGGGILEPKPQAAMDRRQSAVLGGNLLLSKDGKQ